MAIKSYGLMTVDWEERVNVERLRTERLTRIKRLLKESEMGALLCFDMVNVRYITATHLGTWAMDKLARFTLLPQDDEPILWDFGSAARHHQMLGRQVMLDIVDDTSSDTQTTTNYTKLITQDHVDLLFGPFSMLLTKPASVVADRYGYALVEGAGGGPSVFNRGLNDVFDVSLPVANNPVSFTQLMAALPAGTRPMTAAYATEDDPFTQPQVDLANQDLTMDGIPAAIPEIIYPAETTDFTPNAQKLIAAHADIVVLGTLLPDVTAFIQAFKQQHYNPKAIIATAGPDQGTQFLNAIGGAQFAEGIMVPNGWFPEANNPGNAQMVQEYIQQSGIYPAIWWHV
jgi:branched-chain amino acid transport system substrate-binding protein